ncbi:MAG: LuxR C-terminal-related transcriptional regulator [Dehalococcoidia bacterium]
MDSMVVPKPVAAFGPAEKIALRWLLSGMTNREIAGAMGLTPDAIRVMLSEVAAVLGVASRSELIEAIDPADLD